MSSDFYGRIKGLDGLRAIAVGLVFVMHKTVLGALTGLGFYGVWLFFLLSGYLITGQLYTARRRIELGKTKSVSELLTFWGRRALRIFPAYYAVLALISCYYLISHRELRGSIFYLFHISNFYLSANIDQFHTTWAHFWSLAVEEQFYILLAPLVLLTPTRHAVKVCWAIIIVSALQRILLTTEKFEPFQIYIDSLVNFGLLAGGGLFYLLSERVTILMNKSGLNQGLPGWTALLIYLILSVSTTFALSAYPALLQLSYALSCGVGLFVLINVTSGQSNSLVSMLEWPLMVTIGRLSYSMYLINDYVPSDIPRRMMALTARLGTCEGCQQLLEGYPYFSNFLSIFGFLLCFAIVFGAASVSWMLVENPALALRDRIVRSPRIARASIKSLEIGSPHQVSAITVRR